MDRTSVTITINGLESYTNLNAVLLDRQISTITINSLADWMYAAIEGSLLNQSYDFRTIKLTFLVEGVASTGSTVEKDAFKKISRLTSDLKKCTIAFGDWSSLEFNNCFLVDKSTPERVKNGVFKIDYLLHCDFADEFYPTYSTATFTVVNYYTLKVNYILNWSPTMGYYKNAFDEDEIYQTLGTKEVYVAESTLQSIAESADSWDAFYSAVGIDLQLYRPTQENTLMGFVYRNDEDYDSSAAVSAVQNEEDVNVYYNRYSIEGIPDLPEADYPSVVWSVNDENTYYFDLGIGAGWDIQDISIMVWGRYFNTVTAGNQNLFGAGANDPFNMAFTNPDAIVQSDTITTDRTFTVMEDTTSGSQIMVQTLESLSDLPLRKYGFKATTNPKGYIDVYFNSVALDRIPLDSLTLTDNLRLMYGNKGVGLYADACRVQVSYQGTVVLDAIPIAGNVKNGFINYYDTALYDMINMKYIPWTKTNGSTGTSPDGLYSIDGSVTPGPEPTPEPEPTPTPPETPTIFGYDAASESSLKEIAEGDLDGSNSAVWSTTGYDGDIPDAYGYFAAVYSTPNVAGTLTYNGKKFQLDGNGQLDDGRYYYLFTVLAGKSSTGNTLIYTPTDTSIEATTLTFAIKSV